MVDPKDREAYEQGLRDSNKGIFEEMVSDAVDAALPGTMSPSEEAAYYKGRRGEEFDDDKDEDE